MGDYIAIIGTGLMAFIFGFGFGWITSKPSGHVHDWEKWTAVFAPSQTQRRVCKLCNRVEERSVAG